MKISRRDFLKTTALTSLYFAGFSAHSYANSAKKKNLVIIMLRGGMDGLCAIPVKGDKNFEKLRNEIIYPSSFTHKNKENPEIILTFTTCKRLDLFNACGIKYIMLDTYDKNNGDLLSFCNISNLNKFISKCKKFDIKIGLAGSLKETHIPLVMKLKPNILGFRSAICQFNKRMSEVDTRKLKKISRHFNLCNNKAIETAGA